MKVIFKTIVGREIVREVDPNAKIEDVKKLFEDDYVPSNLHFCYRGVILDSTKTLAELHIEENGVLIISGHKRKNQKPQSNPEGAVPGLEGTGVVKEEQEDERKVTNSAPSTEGLAAPVSTTSRPAEDAPFLSTAAPVHTTNEIDPSLVDVIVGMGFEDREKVTLALRAAYGNVDRAVDFLCNGIPESALPGSTGPETNVSTVSGEPLQFLSRVVSQVRRGESESALQQALMNIPQFEGIRAIVQTNPQSLPTVVQQLGRHHPEIMELIQQNPDEFMEIMLGSNSMGFAAGAEETDGRLTHIEVPLAEGERDAINRLVELGGGTWSEHDALQAYRAFEEDEEAAAHFLFGNFFGDNE